ncbi:hypothetical protein ILYODFUR_000850 [Ilyodon furcidens]|uniref:Uncharacterized protein n=1 Tax=Ilyodon furcidens TaxID=33524 RepID=A0ABV0SJ96_9TELE
MPSAAHIYIFINAGLYNEQGLCQEQQFLLVLSPDFRNKAALNNTSGMEKVHTVHLWLGEEDQPMSHDLALTLEPNQLNNDLNHNHNLGEPKGLDTHAVNKD